MTQIWYDLHHSRHCDLGELYICLVRKQCKFLIQQKLTANQVEKHIPGSSIVYYPARLQVAAESITLKHIWLKPFLNCMVAYYALFILTCLHLSTRLVRKDSTDHRLHFRIGRGKQICHSKKKAQLALITLMVVLFHLFPIRWTSEPESWTLNALQPSLKLWFTPVLFVLWQICGKDQVKQ